MDAAAILLFDGDCAYCNGWVNWIRRRDRAGRFRYVALNSTEGSTLRTRLGIPDRFDSVVLVFDDRAYLKSEAAWRILSLLPGYGIGSWAMRVVPLTLRDRVYDLVARNRHRLGPKNVCELPDT